jgi:tetratricopeptide (TPR) repeat protein
MSLFDQQGIPEALLHQNYQDDSDIEANFEDDLSTLTSFLLVTMNVKGNEFEMYRLVQFLMKKWLELYDELENWKEKHIDIMEDAFPVRKHENRAICGLLFPHAQMVLLYCPTNEVYLAQWASILFNAAWYSRERGSYNIAEEMACRSLAGYEKALGEEHLNTLASVSNLAVGLLYQGKYEQAEELNRRALVRYEKVLGQEHPNTLVSVSNLALVLQYQGKYEQAEELNRRALAGSEKVLGKEHPDTLISVYCLAYLLHQRDEYEDALTLYQRAYTGFQKTLGPDHPTTKACSYYYNSLLEHSRGK